MADWFEFGVYQDGLQVAASGGPDRDAAFSEAWHYAIQYAQDGPVELREIAAAEGVE